MRGGHAFARDAAERLRRIDSCQIEILESIALGAAPDAVLGAIARLAEDLVPGAVAGVTILDRARRQFDGAVFPSLAREFAAGIAGTSDAPPSLGGYAAAVYRGETVTCANIGEDERFGGGWRALHRDHGIRAMRSEPACAPDGTPLGGFVLGFREPRLDGGWGEEAMAVGARLAGLALESRRRRQQQSLVIAELRHRTNNLLSLIGAIAQVTFKGSPEAIALRAAFEGRMRALTKAHFLLLNRHWTGTDLADLLGEILAPYRRGDRVTIVGPRLVLSPRAALAFGLAVHELATNAAKYGALSVEDGKIRVAWATERGPSGEAWFRFGWIESGGPPVAQPSRRGLGSHVIERGLAQQVDGTARLEFAPDGLRCQIDAPCATTLAMDGLETGAPPPTDG